MLGRAAFSSLALSFLAACGPRDPSDDPDDWDVDTSAEYRIEVSDPRWMVPSARLPDEVQTMASNNNVNIVYFQGRLFMGFRTSPNHWASADTKMYLVSSEDDGETWIHEQTIAIGKDVREPQFLVMNDRLFFFFFEASDNLIEFRPKHIWRIERLGEGRWTEKEAVRSEGEVHWDMKVRGGVAYLTSYRGNHYYSADESTIEVYFSRSQDGLTWDSVSTSSIAYRGGVSEAAFELDTDGSAWFVLRNEDGDRTGFGSHLCHAAKEALGTWDCPAKSDPERYDSPEMFRHGDDLFLVARRDVGGPYDEQLDLDFLDARRQYLLDYWTRPKRTALYRIDREARKVVFLMDLPSAGDTAFPSIRRTGAHTYLLANYTSPPDDPDRSWIEGQGADDGTRIYFVELTFVAE